MRLQDIPQVPYPPSTASDFETPQTSGASGSLALTPKVKLSKSLGSNDAACGQASTPCALHSVRHSGSLPNLCCYLPSCAAPPATTATPLKPSLAADADATAAAARHRHCDCYCYYYSYCSCVFKQRTRNHLHNSPARDDPRENMGSESMCSTLRWDGMKMLS